LIGLKHLRNFGTSSSIWTRQNSWRDNRGSVQCVQRSSATETLSNGPNGANSELSVEATHCNHVHQYKSLREQSSPLSHQPSYRGSDNSSRSFDSIHRQVSCQPLVVFFLGSRPLLTSLDDLRVAKWLLW
jgi:hypothetical protein